MNNTPVDDTQYIDVVMPVCNLITSSDIYSKTSGSLWQDYKDEPGVDNNNVIDFLADNNS